MLMSKNENTDQQVWESIVFFLGATAQLGPGPPHFWGFQMTHNDTTQSVGLLWTDDRQATLTKDKYPCFRQDFFIFPGTLYFIRPCFFFLVVLLFVFCLYIQHKTQTSVPPSGFFFLFVVYPHFFVLTVLAFAFCPHSTTHTTQTSMPPAGFESAITAHNRP